MHSSSLLANIILLFSVFHVALAGQEQFAAGPAKLQVRQVPATPAPVDVCLDYETTANISTVGANSSYRTVVLQKANVGTITSARMLDAAIAKLPALTANLTLNQQCGNWTEIALIEAAVNFTQGKVLQFTTAGLPVGIYAGPSVVVIVAAVCAIFSLVWVFAG